MFIFPLIFLCNRYSDIIENGFNRSKEFAIVTISFLTLLFIMFLLKPCLLRLTSLIRVLKRKFGFFSTYVEMYHTSTILWWPVGTHFSASVSPLTSRFPLTMAISNFSPYHRLWPNDAPAECAGITPTPWVMMPTLSFVSYDRGHKLLVPPPNNAFVGFVF